MTLAALAVTGAEPVLVNATYNKGRARALHGAMHALNDEISAQAAAGNLATTSARWRAWKRWLEGYGKWYGQIPDSLPESLINGWGTGGVGSMLDSYEREMVDWRNWYGRTFRTEPAGIYNPVGTEAGQRDGAGFPQRIPPWAWAVIGVGGVYALAKFVNGLR